MARKNVKNQLKKTSISGSNIGFESELWQMADALRGSMDAAEYKYPDLKADRILANPPFNVSDWGGERLREDKRWQYGVPPAGNANFARVPEVEKILEDLR